MDSSPPGSSRHRILQARILEWVAIPFSRGFSWPRDQILVSCIAGRFFTIWATSWHFKMMIFFIFAQLMRYPLIELLHLSSLLQMPKTVEWLTEFFGNFLCSYKMISFNDPLNWSLSTSDGWPLHSSSSRLSSPLENFLNHHCTVCLLAVPGPNALLMLQVVSAAFMTHFELD